MSTMSQCLAGNSGGFATQGFAPSAPHFNQPPPSYGAPLPPAAAQAQQFDYPSHGQFSAVLYSWFVIS